MNTPYTCPYYPKTPVVKSIFYTASGKRGPGNIKTEWFEVNFS